MYISSLASFLVWGGGGEPPPPPPPQMYRQKKSRKCNLYARANEASERLRSMIFSGLKILTSAYMYNQCSYLPFITYGMAQQTRVCRKILILRKNNVYARERSESLENVYIFTF